MVVRPNGWLGKDRNPGNARWCEEHNRLECVKNKRGGTQCHAPALRGNAACKQHVGIRKAVAKARGEAKVTAWTAIGDTSKGIDHQTAVMATLHMSWLRMNAYAKLLGEQVLKEGGKITVPGPMTAGGLQQLVDSGGERTDGLIGYRYGAAGSDGTIYAVSEEVRALVKLEAEERDRVVKYAKTAHDMGISARMTDLAEAWGEMIAGKIAVMFDALGLTPEQQVRVPALIRAHLGEIEVGAASSQEPVDAELVGG